MQEHEARMNQHHAQFNSQIQNEGGFSPGRPGPPIHMTGVCDPNFNPHLHMMNNPAQIQLERFQREFEINRGRELEGRDRAPSGFQMYSEYSENHFNYQDTSNSFYDNPENEHSWATVEENQFLDERKSSRI